MKFVTYELNVGVTKQAQSQQFPATPNALRRVLDQYGFMPRYIRRIASGTENETFMVDCLEGSFVLRVYRQQRKRRSEMYRELDFMIYLAEHGLPVPRVTTDTHDRILSETTINGVTWQSILMSQMPGEHPRVYSAELLIQMAHVQARLHLLGRQYVTRVRSVGQALEVNTPSLWQRLGTGLRNNLRDIIEQWVPRGIVHFDFTPGNVLYKSHHITAVLDFDDMACASLVNCLATTLVRLPDTLQTPETINTYLAAYESIRPLRPAERTFLHILLSVKRLRHRLAPAAA